MKAFSVDLALQMKRIQGFELSADGSFGIALVSVDILDENKTQSDLWLVPLDGRAPRPLTFGGLGGRPAISPDGNSVAFLSTRGADHGSQIYLLPLSGGEAQRLTDLPGRVVEFAWAADSASLIFAAPVLPGFTDWQEEKVQRRLRQEKKTTARVWTSTPVMDWDRFVDESETHLFRCFIDGKRIESLTPGTGLHLPRFTGGPLATGPHFAMDPSGKYLALTIIGDEKLGAYRRDIALLDCESRTFRNLTADNPGNDFAPQYSPDGKTLQWLRQINPGFYADQHRLVLADPLGNTIRCIDHSWDRSLSRIVWAADSQSLYAEVEDAGVMRIYSVPLHAQSPQPLTDRVSVFGVVGNRLGPQTILALRHSFNEPPALIRLEASDSSILWDPNAELVNSINWGTYESVTYAGADGQAIQMWVNYPPDFDPTKRYPLFLMIHGGPHVGINNGMFWRWNAQLFAALGYVTAWHNFHGSSGFGQAFVESIDPEWAEKPYQDTIKAAEWFQQQPWIDPNRMVAGGGSYGGYLTTILLGREHPFQALINHAGVYNLFTQYGCDVFFIRKRHGEFWEDPAGFERNSPHVHAAKFRTPTMIIHGHQDFRVPINHAFELFHTLQKRGIESRLLTFSDENHWVLKPQNALQWFTEVKAWIQRFAPTEG